MAFPVSPLLSTFDPPAENPLSEGGNWTVLYVGGRPLKKSNTNTATDSIHDGPNYSAWTTSYPGDVECWGCTAGGQLGAALETWRVALFLTPHTNLQGYLLYFGGGLGKGFVIRRYDGGSVSNWKKIASLSTIQYPNRLGIAISGTTIQGWSYNSGVWTLRLSVADNTFRGSFHPVLGIEDPSGGGLGFTCFGGGGPRNRTQDIAIKRLIPTST